MSVCNFININKELYSIRVYYAHCSNGRFTVFQNSTFLKKALIKDKKRVSIHLANYSTVHSYICFSGVTEDPQ